MEMPTSHYDSLQKNELTYWWHLSRLDRAERLVRAWVPSPEKLRVLEIGCGTGGFLESMRRRLKFTDLMGQDISREAISRSLQYGPHYQVVEPEDFSEVRRADLVFLMDVLEHVPDDAGMISGLAANLPEGAVILASMPAHQGLFSSWDRALGHHRRYSKGDCRLLAEGSGLTLLHAEYAFAVVAAAVFVRRVLGREDCTHCEFPPVPAWLNSLLRTVNRTEGILSGRLALPMGGSVFALFRKDRGN